jgi:hypothetical protein
VIGGALAAARTRAGAILARMRPPWHQRAWPVLLIFHAALVALLLAAFFGMVWSTGPGDGAAIGAGLVALPLLVLGLPWSVPALTVDPSVLDGIPLAVHALVDFGPAVLNLALHAAIFALHERRRSRGSVGGGL